MKSGKVSKMATVLAVLFLVVSGLMVVQWNAQPVEATEHETQTYTIEGFLNTNVSVQSDLDITLRDLSSGETMDVETSEAYYQFPDVKAGWYEIIFPSQVGDDNAFMREKTDPFKLSSQEDSIRDIDIESEVLDEDITVEVTEKGEGEPSEIENATVTLKDTDLNFEYTEKIENSNEGTIDIYSDFEGMLIVNKEGYSPNITSNVLLNRNNFDIELSKRPIIEGNLVDESGSGITEMLDITLYNEELGVMHRTKMGPTFRYRAAPGYNYTLVVKAPGHEPLIKELDSLEEDSLEKLGRSEVKESGTEQFVTDIAFDGIETMSIDTSRTLNAGSKMKTMDYSYIGNLAMQIDLALGDGDLVLEENETEDFKDRLEYTEDLPTSYDLITVDETVYEQKSTDMSFSGISGETGPVSEAFSDEIEFKTNKEYTAMGDLDADSDRYVMDFTVEHDYMFGNQREFDYTMSLPDGYERYKGGAQDIPEKVNVMNYTELEIETEAKEDGETSTVTLDVRESEEGQAEIELVSPAPWIMKMDEDKYDYDYVIRKGKEAELKCTYTNPTSSALEFNWELGNEVKDGQQISKTFNETGMLTISVEVPQTNGNTVSDQVKFMVDEEGPSGSILVDEVAKDDSANLDEDTEISFSGAEITDAETGLVKNYRWNFTDTEPLSEGMNVTHTFGTPGEYEVILNVTDGVGNTKEESITVNVSDKTKPTGEFKMEWDDQESYQPQVNIEKGTEVTFNASEMRAHEEYEGNLEYDWSISGIGESFENKEIISYTFQELGEYSVDLNVTDNSGNFKEISKNVTVQRGPTPDLMISEITFSKSDVQTGDEVTISTEVTNVGGKTAEDITVTLRVDGKIIETFESDGFELYKNDEKLNRTTIEDGETVMVEMDWTPDSDGDKNVNVNITDSSEVEFGDNENEIERSIDVSPPAWREYLVYALIPIVIIGIVVGLYFYRDKISETLK